MGLIDWLTSRKSQAAVADEADVERRRIELKRRNELIAGQKQREERAKEQRVFTKKQRCFYFHKPTEMWLDTAQVVGVHCEDDPQNPYYTIQYSPLDSDEVIEKQTTRNRLAYIEWDEELTWRILSKRQ